MPDWKAHIRPRLASLRLSPTRENEIVDELAQHLDDRWREAMAGGAAEDEATRVALAQLRDDVLVRNLVPLRQAHARHADHVLDETPVTSKRAWLERLAQDVRFGARMLGRHRGLTFVAVLSLALAIGANAAVFALVDAVLLRPLGFTEPERLVLVWEASDSEPTQRGNVAPGNYRDWQTRSRTLQEIAAFSTMTVNLSGDGDPEQLSGQAVTPNFFDVLGVRPTLGRTFMPSDARDGAPPQVVVVSHRFWQQRFGARSVVAGTDLLLDGHRLSVVGVMPRGFQVIDATADIWLPVMPPTDDRGSHYLTVFGRLNAGTSLAQAQTDLDALTQHIARDFPKDAASLRAFVMPLREHLVGKARPVLSVLFGAVGAVLLIACANVANLLLARASARRAEIAVRTTLGATRARVVRQLLTESVLLAGLGGLAGLVLAPATFSLLAELVPPAMLNSATVSLSLPMLAFTALVTLATGIGFGVLPAFQITRRTAFDVLRQAGGRSAVAARRGVLRGALVVTEVALCLVVVVAAALLVQTFTRLRGIEPGFRPEGVLTLGVRLPRHVQADFARRSAFYAQVLERLDTMPAVAGAAVTTAAPLTWKGGSNGLSIDGQPPQPGQSAVHRQVSATYFSVMGMSLRAGRVIDDRDGATSLPVAVVNETMARQFWPGGNAVGKRFKIGPPESPNPWVTVIGVTRDVKNIGLDAPVRAEMYLPYRQVSYNASFAPAALVVRTGGDPAGLIAAIRRAVTEVDPTQPVSNVKTLEEILTTETATRRVGAWLMGGFAALSLILAAVGLYGVLSYTVSQRLPELGLRMALGAQRIDVLALVLRYGMNLALLGCGLGIAASFVLTRWMSSLLFEVSPTDMVTFASVAALLASIALAACYVPARRAMKADVVGLLR
jgi:putative ABC transport system permease protein